MIKNMPVIASNLQPTIAIITYQYCEKMAVDAMMENKTTYVRYKTEGDFLCALFLTLCASVLVTDSLTIYFRLNC